LTRAGYRVVTGSDGRSALKKIAAEHPDLVIADVIMPSMDGYELCRRIKDDPQSSSLPVILVSGLGDTHDQYWRKQARADLYLAKSADSEKLLKAVEDLLAGKAPEDLENA